MSLILCFDIEVGSLYTKLLFDYNSDIKQENCKVVNDHNKPNHHRCADVYQLGAGCVDFPGIFQSILHFYSNKKWP
jgi:hypothetical protein